MICSGIKQTQNKHKHLFGAVVSLAWLEISDRYFMLYLFLSGLRVTTTLKNAIQEVEHKIMGKISFSNKRNQYSDNTRGVKCNECYRTLTNVEIAVYPTMWRYSGDMYCIKHETRNQFTSQYAVRIVTYTSYSSGNPVKWYAVARPNKNGFMLLTAWYDTRRESWNQYCDKYDLISKLERDNLHHVISKEIVR